MLKLLEDLAIELAGTIAVVLALVLLYIVCAAPLILAVTVDVKFAWLYTPHVLIGLRITSGSWGRW